MPENTEITRVSEGEREEFKNPLSNPKKENSSHSLSFKMDETRSGAQTRAEKLSTLLKACSTGANGESQIPLSSQDLTSRMDSLSHLQPLEFLTQSSQIVKDSEAAKIKAEAEIEKAQIEEASRQRDIRSTSYKVKDLSNQKNLIKRFIGSFQKRRLHQQITLLENKSEASQSSIISRKHFIIEINKSIQLIAEKQDEILLSEAAADIAAISADYKALLQEILDDETLIGEIQDAYIHDVISPRLDESNIPADKKDAFYFALRNYLKHPSAPEEEKQSLRQELDKFANEDGFYWIRDSYQALLHGLGRRVITKLVGKITASDIRKIITILEPRFNSDEARWNLEILYNTVINPGRWISNDGSLIQSILSELEQNNGSSYPDMDLWAALKSSVKFSRLFGELIADEDKRILTHALERSLSDNQGRDINMLVHYPTPESIRNLVIIAAADYSKYRTVRANRALCRLARRDNWSEILDEAVQLYQALITARPFLEHWNYGKESNNPGVQDAAKDFALEIMESEQTDPRLRKLAAESLTNDSILSLLAKRKILPEREIEILSAADTFLSQHSQEVGKRYREDDYSIPHVSAHSFTKGLRENLLSLISQQPGEVEEQPMAIIKRFESLSQAILENRANYPILRYLTHDSVINKIDDPTFKADALTIFLEAYQACPVLLVDNDRGFENNFLAEFCRQFEGEQTVIFFRNLSDAYRNHSEQLNQIVTLVGNNVLSGERALELPIKAQSVLSSPRFFLATSWPQLFLETDDGLEFFHQADTGSFFTLEKGLQIRIEEKIRHLQTEGGLFFPDLLRPMASQEIEQIDKLLSSENPIEINEQNWQQLLMGYVRSQSEVRGMPDLSQIATEKLNILFEDPKVRDMCLNGLRDSWLTYLKSDKPSGVPFSLNFMSKFINYCGGTGPLSQIESLNALINSVDLAFLKETTVERTKLEISEGLVRMEARFNKERWSNEDRTDFYNISRDILGAAPSRFTDYLALFEDLSASQMRSFTKELYPLYKTKLVLIEKKDEKGHPSYDVEQLLQIRKDIRNFADEYKAEESSLENQKQKLLEEIRGLFKVRFGIIKIPQEITSEHTRSFTNVSNYLANFNSRNAEKETILGFYLSMMINDRWDAFRRGEIIDPEEYLTPEKSSVIKRLLQERQILNPLTSENLGITEHEMPEFFELLQQETQNMVVGNIETIDIKLTNIILNLQGLEDPDLYPDQLDKQRLQLLLDWGNKRVGSVVARMYQSLTKPDKEIQFSQEDVKIQQQITQIIQQLGLSLTTQTLKEHFQVGIKPLATVVNLLNFVRETQAELEIQSLRECLKPSEDVIQVFKRLGEDFKPHSGAMALSQDLSYLDKLITIREDELTPDEKTLLTQYTASIRDQMVKLEEIYSQIKNKFENFKQGNSSHRNLLLQDKFDQIDRVINSQTTQQAITSTASNNLNPIIEYMRECLSCTREGFNNDTNLTFGDANKFYLYSQSENQQRGSISDQIAFVEPVTRADGSQSMAFVLDRIYGTNTPTILVNQVDAILKKYRSIKQRFPDIKLFVFVTNAAAHTGGTSLSILQERFKAENITAEQELVVVDVAKSATGDHYIEFGGSVRTAGKRQVNGLVLSL